VKWRFFANSRQGNIQLRYTLAVSQQRPSACRGSICHIHPGETRAKVCGLLAFAVSSSA
jgi:hypothetical protein